MEWSDHTDCSSAMTDLNNNIINKRIQYNMEFLLQARKKADNFKPSEELLNITQGLNITRRTWKEKAGKMVGKAGKMIQSKKEKESKEQM